MAKKTERALESAYAPRISAYLTSSLLAPLSALLAVVFYFGWMVDPQLIHYAQQPYFRMNHAFFAAQCSHVGGLTEYAAAYLGLFLRFQWGGAVLLGLVALAICLLWRISLRGIGMSVGALRYLLPLFSIAWIHGNYEAPLSATLGGLFALLLFVALLSLRRRPFWMLNLGFVVLSGFLFYLTGGAVLLFLGFYLLHLCFDEVLRERVSRLARLGAGVFAVFVVGLTPALFNTLFFHELTPHVYERFLPHALDRGAPCALSAYYSALGLESRGMPVETAFLHLVLCGIGLATGLSVSLSAWRPVRAVREAIDRLRERRIWAWILSAPVTLSCAAVLVLMAFNGNEKQLVTLRYEAETGAWSEYCDHLNGEMASHPIFDVTQVCKITDLVTVLLNNNRMLYHVGALPQHLFSYPQWLGASGLLPGDSKFYLENHVIFLPVGDLLFEMGRVNEAERMFYEGWAYYGERASILWRLAKLNLVKERPEAARIFLNILKEVPFEREAAEKTERDMERDPALAWAPELLRIRNSNFTVDFPGTIYGPQEQLLAALLSGHPENRMVFEYLMAYLLLTSQSENAAKLVPACKRYGYTALPRHYEEVVLDYMAAKGLRQFDLGGYSLNPETVARFTEFQRLAATCNGDPVKARDVLAPGFADTYWFYKATGGPIWGIKDGKPITLGATSP